MALSHPTLLRGLSDTTSTPKSALTGVAVILSSCILPAIVTSYLDAECWGRWTVWWPPCTQQSHLLEFPAETPGSLYYHIHLTSVLGKQEVCLPQANPSAASCVRSIALKLRDVVFGKLVTSAFVIPASKLLTYKHRRGTR